VVLKELERVLAGYFSQGCKKNDWLYKGVRELGTETNAKMKS
jgi:hypothetical protein